MRGDRGEAIADVAAGEGVLSAGGDVAAQTPLRRAGERIRAIDVAAMCAAGIERQRACRALPLSLGGEPGLRALRAAIAFLIRADFDAGASVSSSGEIELEPAIADEKNAAVIAVGGTGGGRHDHAVKTLARSARGNAWHRRVAG